MLYISSVMVLCFLEPSLYCDFGVARRRYLTVHGSWGHTNKLCRHIIRKTVSMWGQKTYAVVTRGDFVELELKVPDESDQNASNLEVSKLKDVSVSCEDYASRQTAHVLANAAMPPSAKRLIHTLGSLTDESVTIVHLLSG